MNSRREVLKKIAIAPLAGASLPILSSKTKNMNLTPESLKGRINHAACQWCYNSLSLDELCAGAQKIGLKGIDLLGPKEWPTLKKYGLTCSMPQGAGKGISKGFNDPKLHDELVESYVKIIPLVAEAGFKQIICFSGNRRGLDDEEGAQHCIRGLKRVMPVAEKHGITMCMELLNSKVDHHDYQADHTAWGAKVCEGVGSDRMKLLYDIYHMQIMEGDVIATIRKYHPFISHYHTGGVPGRNEIDETQELNYPAIMKAILETGYDGFVAQEFIPTWPDKLAALKQGVEICDV